uniref:Transmembrane protein n=1 Tax=Cucumis melo TaxID=3656 RepID=A0A9I9ELX5_CUCME
MEVTCLVLHKTIIKLLKNAREKRCNLPNSKISQEFFVIMHKISLLMSIGLNLNDNFLGYSHVYVALIFLDGKNKLVNEAVRGPTLKIHHRSPFVGVRAINAYRARSFYFAFLPIVVAPKLAPFIFIRFSFRSSKPHPPSFDPLFQSISPHIHSSMISFTHKLQPNNTVVRQGMDSIGDHYLNSLGTDIFIGEDLDWSLPFLYFSVSLFLSLLKMLMMFLSGICVDFFVLFGPFLSNDLSDDEFMNPAHREAAGAHSQRL